MTNPQTTLPAAAPHPPASRPLLTFAAVAVPTGWLMLGIPVLTGWPVEPFVLLTLALGLVVPAIWLTRRDPGATVRQLLRDCVRLPHPLPGIVPALALVPGLTWGVAALSGEGPVFSADLLIGAAVNVVSSVLIVNLWEEMAWNGFFQRRAISRWGVVAGSMLTGLMFVGVHLPLAFADVETRGDIAFNLGALVASGIGLRLLIAGFDAWTGRSLLAVALLHASFNVAAEFVEPDHDWIRYVVVLVLGLAVLLTPIARDRGPR